jgi:methionyl-tRNA synthetase
LGNDRTVVIIAPPPTPNGDLHVGHLAGPYLAGDVYARYLRACGRRVIYTTGTDDSQTFVVATARRQGITPQELALRCWHDIRRTLEVAAISVDGFAPFDDRYRARALEFVTALHAAGKFRLRTVRLPYSERTGEFLMEGLIAGDCPICLTESRGGCCETCGQANDNVGLIDPHSTVDPTDPLTTREATILVLPLEEYRDQLTAYYEDRAPKLRPHIAQLVQEVLSKPLPEFPITYPYHWGIPAPFPETPGQVLNAWVEGMPASMYCTAFGAEQLGAEPVPTDELWRDEHDVELVYFLGFDNAYFWGMTHLSLLFAHDGRYVVPDTIVSNEFYELENEKFSTSKGHVVWMRDLLLEVPRDLVRFYLALTAPEHQRTSFSRAALLKVTGERLVDPWNRLAVALADVVERLDVAGQALAVPQEAVRRSAALEERFHLCYRLTSYSLTRAADAIVSQVGRLERTARSIAADPTATLSDVAAVYHELLVLLACAAPILVDLTEEVRRRTGQALTISSRPGTEVTPFPVPALSLSASPVAVVERVG